VVLTARDREVLAPLAGNTPLVEIPLAQDVPEEALDPLGTSPPEILFVGSFIHAPNVDAALRLAERIFPLVRVRCPQATLYLVGDQPPPELRRLASERVVVTGRVPTVEPYLDRAAVTVAPLRAGGGMRVKVMEALGAGKATVASPLAVAGLDLVDGREIVLADSDEDFAAAIVNLLEHPERREQLARAARAWATAPRGGQDRASRYLSLYASLLERFPAGVRR
jgi:glycosyltransferase involved in cell wall biosynthesis